ncbi:MAG TPA: EAL domain-containing protein [Acidimicrobiales bacterium]|nr:EAL domain-containing protein [Acidimicrobiales bacterium]
MSDQQAAERRRHPSAVPERSDDEDPVEALAYAATHDPLTGLPNRSLLDRRLVAALDRHRRREETVAVIFLDLDLFKKVNDSLGHRAGDELLVAAAGRIQSVIRPSDTVARFGGDEFVVICEGLIGEIEAMGIADRIREALERVFVVQSHEVYVSASLGVAFPRSDDYDAESILADADTAMFRAKEAGRGRCEPYDRRMRERAIERLETEAALRRALETGQLRLAYQPVVDLASGRIDAVEALVRWDHPERGLLNPDSFIALAEETGLIVAVGSWAIDAAFAQQARWSGTGLSSSVNVSGRQLTRPELVGSVGAAIEASGVDPARIHLEITENAVIEDPAATMSALRALKALGVGLVLDDFGTGYASLSALRRFPIDGIKVDRSFVRGVARFPEDRAIVRAVVRLASDLGLSVVAEGVESTEQRDVLLELGCRRGQGYLFSAALGPEEVELLANR